MTAALVHRYLLGGVAFEEPFSPSLFCEKIVGADGRCMYIVNRCFHCFGYFFFLHLDIPSVLTFLFVGMIILCVLIDCMHPNYAEAGCVLVMIVSLDTTL